jgi:hypothetical protein
MEQEQQLDLIIKHLENLNQGLILVTDALIDIIKYQRLIYLKP